MANNKKKNNIPDISKMKHRYVEYTSNIESIAEQFGCKIDDVKNELINKLISIEFITKFALIEHDKDVDENGNPIKNHIHCAIGLKYSNTLGGVANALGVPVNCIEVVKQKKSYGSRLVADFGGLLSYLTHANDKSKYQYSDSNVIASEGWNWRKERNKSLRRTEYNVESIVNKIIDGEINQSNLTNYIDEIFYINNKRVIEDTFEYKRKVMLKETNRNMQCIYVYGIPGSGKTTLAKEFGKNLGLDVFVSGGSNDLFDGYGGQKCIVLDDARPECFAPEDWLKILDNNTSSLVKARYKNVVLQADYIIITSTITIYDFFNKYEKEDKTQLYRRCKMMIEIDKEYITFYSYDKLSAEYKFIKKEKNLVLETFKESELDENDKQKIIDNFKFKGGFNNE